MDTLENIVKYNINISSSEFNEFINSATKSKSRSYLSNHRILILPICKVSLPDKAQMDKILTIYSQKYGICDED